ncbi:MAG: GntR family transcriptional regulator [Pseudomonadales bacterium]|nr:GntR family transcriptional regulator [Pseudomonadales bacterium]
MHASNDTTTKAGVLTTEHTDFILSQADGRPMYLQIMEQIRQRVAVADWPAGTRLPSIRELAVALSVSVITVKRAYLELEREGFIVTRQGKGSWISERVDQRAVQRQELLKVLEQAAALARSAGVPAQELLELLCERVERTKEQL